MSVQTEEPRTEESQAEQETFRFQAEVVQILDLMVHSLYSNKEIFLRELISNASDAIDRLRLELLSRAELPEDEGPLQIRVSYDSGAGTITIADNGIGMNRHEVIQHIGIIAKSGTREFLHALTGDQREDATLIGQFGVGFYSSFIVAERVILTTRRAGLAANEGVRWESDGRGEYTLEPAECPTRGTTIVLKLRDGEDDLLNEYRLRSIIQKYSDHISLPIVLASQPEKRQATSQRTTSRPSPSRRSTRRPRYGSGLRANSVRRTTTASTGTSPVITLIHWPGCTARSRGPTSTRCCCSSPPVLPTTCGSRSLAAASSCIFGESSSLRTTAS